MVLRSTGDETVPFPHQELAERGGVGLHLLGVCLEPRRRGLFQRHGEGPNLVVVRATLKRRENGEVDFVLEFINSVLRLPLLGRLRTLPVEDHARPGTAQALMRRGGDNVAILEGVVSFLRSHKATDVRHVAEEECAALVRDFPEAFVLPVARVSAAAADYHLGPEVQRLLLQSVVVDEPRGGVHLVRKTLEVYGGGGDLLPAGGVVPVGEVTTGGQIQPHDAVVRVQHRRVGGKVGRGARVGLHIDTPRLNIEVEGSQSA